MRETRGGLNGMIAEVQKGAALFLSCKSSVRNLQNAYFKYCSLVKLEIYGGSCKCQDYMMLNKPCASEEHANLPVGRCVRHIKQKLKVVVMTRGQLEQKSQSLNGLNISGLLSVPCPEKTSPLRLYSYMEYRLFHRSWKDA